MKITTLGPVVFVASFFITSISLHKEILPQTAIFVYEHISSFTHQSATVVLASPKVTEQEIVLNEIVKPVVPVIPPFEPAQAMWKNATMTAEWAPRDSAASFVFNDKMWIMGGLSGNNVSTNSEHEVHYWEAPYFNDIWSSADGVTWVKEKEHAEWEARRSMSVVSFNNKLWMLGGWSPITGYTSDVWQSDNGTTWTRVVRAAAWPAREGQTVEVFQNKLWLIGGVNYDERNVKNDVWYSDNGLAWHEATGTIPWSPRWDHAVAVFDNKLYLTGGMNVSKETFDDVWSSTDGIQWESVIRHAPWQNRQGHGLTVFKDALWSIGRLNDDVEGGKNDVWYSKNGSDWQKTDIDPEWLGREDHGVLTFKDAIYVLGGMDANWVWRNDVWKLE